jgi:soluble lytic murein transglycosylase-like protein
MFKILKNRWFIWFGIVLFVFSIAANIVLINKFIILKYLAQDTQIIEPKLSYEELDYEEKRAIFEENLKYHKRDTNLRDIKILIEEMQPKLDRFIIDKIAESILKYSEEYNIPHELITILIYRESSFNTTAVSSAKCVGLMQINPAAHKDKIKDLGLNHYDLFKIDNNIKLGCMILHEYYVRDNDIIKALGRYVGGEHQKYINDIAYAFMNVGVKKIFNRYMDEEDIISEDNVETSENSENPSGDSDN